MTADNAPYDKYPRVQGYVWDCGDDYCGCSQAEIDWVVPNPRVGLPWIERTAIWTGEFYTDHEAGALGDLARIRNVMVECWPEAARRVEWATDGR